MRYQILDDETIEGLVQHVQAAIEAGWTPVGDVSVSTFEEDVDGDGFKERRTIYVQAMIANP